ncbi:hypothetical protein [Zongyangia hominis]|uniref:Uncharacterized protein n=1 Tax=Zongyangia hominis TaxID=2763677 RepID=A0A926E8U9_9FIRM|nr:hypothetical protein [Zongyangia hominis]MBC8569452.1 hypothetical protein [Zongyangia hominis]
MGKTFAYIGCVLMVLITAAFAAAFFTGQAGADEQALVAESSVPVGDYQYVLKDYGGKLAVFEANSVTPDIVFNVYTKNLPEFDVKELKSGVYVRDSEELGRLIEDYIS